MPFRLSGSPTLEAGRVEYLQGYDWGTLSANFGEREASIVCKQLGFSQAMLAPAGTFAGPAAGSLYWKVSLDCLGGEADLRDCIMASTRATKGTLAEVFCGSEKGAVYYPGPVWPPVVFSL